jgi:translation initiation factor 2D
VKKFVKHLDKEKLVKSKDRNGGETVILDVDFDDAQVQAFVPYKLPSKATADTAGKSVPSNQFPNGGDTSVGQTITVKTLYRPSGKLTPTIFPSLSNSDPKNFHSYSSISTHLNEYISSQDPPIASPTNPRILSLNPFIVNTILSSSSGTDTAALPRKYITRDALLKRIIEDPILCAPYHIILRSRSNTANQSAETPKPKAGPTPKIAVTIERRTGSKAVTKVVGLEAFGIVPLLLAEELQKKCACSTSVGQAAGSVKGVMETLVQGDQRAAVEAALAKRGVKSQWVEVVDKTKKKKK